MKHRRPFSNFGTGFGGLIVVALMAISASAQYPALPIGSNGNANYQWRPDLGGWLDPATNLVWGYCTISHINWVVDFAGAQDRARNYAQEMASAETQRLQQAATAESQAALETDPVRKQLRLNSAIRLRAEARHFALPRLTRASIRIGAYRA